MVIIIILILEMRKPNQSLGNLPNVIFLKSKKSNNSNKTVWLQKWAPGEIKEYFLYWKSYTCQNLLLVNKICRRRRGRQRMRWLDGVTDSIGMSLSELREFVMDREAWHATIHGVAKSRTRLSDWTELNE